MGDVVRRLRDERGVRDGGHARAAEPGAGPRGAASGDQPGGPVRAARRAARADSHRPGQDFLSTTATAALGVLAVRVHALPGYTPHLKGSVETLNNAATVMFFAGLPRYTQAPRLANGKPADPDAPALTYEAFVAALLDWVRWWNTAHEIDSLGGRTPLAAWLADPTPLATVPAGDLRLFTLEDDGCRRKITTKGVQWRSRCYVGTDLDDRAGRQEWCRVPAPENHHSQGFSRDMSRELATIQVAPPTAGLTMLTPLLSVSPSSAERTGQNISLAALQAISVDPSDGCFYASLSCNSDDRRFAYLLSSVRSHVTCGPSWRCSTTTSATPTAMCPARWPGLSMPMNRRTPTTR